MGIGEAFQENFDKVKNTASTIGATVQEKGSDAFGAAEQAVGNFGQTLKNKAEEVTGKDFDNDGKIGQ